jgi:hypothetical protein
MKKIRITHEDGVAIEERPSIPIISNSDIFQPVSEMLNNNAPKLKNSGNHKKWLFSDILLGFETFKIVNNLTSQERFTIKRKFKVPLGDSKWPQHIWGMKLGSISDSIRNNNTWKSNKPQLQDIGFDYNPQKYNYSFTEILKAFQVYKTINKIEGTFSVPKSFSVPKESQDWPEDTWGINLGGITKHIRNRGSYKNHREQLLEVGFDYSPQAKKRKIIKPENNNNDDEENA